MRIKVTSRKDITEYPTYTIEVETTTDYENKQDILDEINWLETNLCKNFRQVDAKE